MARAIWKFNYLHYKLLTFLYSNRILKKLKNDLIFVNFFVIPLFINFTLSVYVGNKFVVLKISDKMIGFNIKTYLNLKKISLSKNKNYGKSKKYN